MIFPQKSVSTDAVQLNLNELLGAIMIDSSMLPDFIIEATEHLEELEGNLLLLEQQKEDKDVLNDIFRSMHTIKGAAQFVGIDRVSELSHKLENLLDLVRRGEKKFNEDLFDLLIAGKDRILLLVEELERAQVEETEISDLLESIRNIVDGGAKTAPGESGSDPADNPTASDVDEIDVGERNEKSARLRDDAVEEEYDEELYGIFMQQLKENIPSLQNLAEQYAASEKKTDLLNRCIEKLKGLKSSANYMGYKKLTNHYILWMDAIEGARTALESGREFDLVMQPFIDEIVRSYPQAMEDSGNDSEEEEMVNAIDSLFSDPDNSSPDPADAEESVPPPDGSHQDLESALDSLFAGEDEPSAVCRSEPEKESAAADPQQELEASLDAALLETMPISAEDGQQKIKPPCLENEADGDEYDEELLAIFIGQLRENIPFLQQQAEGLIDARNKTEVLDRCSSAIGTLKSSANYMGYEGLVGHYLAWQEAIDGTVEQLSAGEATADLSFMQLFIDEVVRAYPQALEMRSNDEGSDELATALDTLFVDPGDPDPVVTEEDGPLSFNPDSSEKSEVSEASAAQHYTPVSLADETSGDEYDEELLSIFMQQLEENIPLLQSQIQELDSAVDTQDLLRRCSDTIATLKSSANYMGYDQLALHYSQWQLAIADTVDQLSQGQTPGLSFMNDFIDEIIRAYPQATAEGDKKAAADIDDEPEDVSETIGALLSDNSVDKTHGDKEPAANDPYNEPAVKNNEETLDGAVPESSKKNELFARLSSALDASLEQTDNAPLKPMRDVVEEMITASGDEGAGEDSVEDNVPPVPARKDSKEQSADQVEAEGGDAPELQAQAPAQLKKQPQKQRRQEEDDEVECRTTKEGTARKVRQSMRVDAEKIDFLMNEVGELVVSRAYFAQLFNEMKGLQHDLMEDFGLTKSDLKPLDEFAFRLGEAGVALGRVSNELQEGVMKVRMLPIDQLFKRFPRLVRDLVHKTDKKVDLKTRGEETELDKMVIEEISDPLIHIIRNAVDHGVETASERKRVGKPERGVITLEAYHESEHIVIDVTDDGRGLDDERVKAKALSMGLYSKEELDRMSSLEVKHLIMQPGFSTAEKTTKTSGRGVGMDVVRKNIEKLNGTVEIETKVGKGTRIRVKIPLTMAIIQALMVRVGPEKFTIPLTAVEETLRIFQSEISEIEGVDVIHLRDSTMPIFRLSKLFGIQRNVENDEKNFVVVVSTGLQELGLVVDELLGQEEVVIKPLADYLQLDSGFSGATILGDGRISLILDIPELVHMTTRKQVSKQQQLAGKRRILDGTASERQAQPIQ